MRQLAVTLFILFVSINSIACSCVPMKLSERFQSSSFVGVVKITGFETVTIDSIKTFHFKVETLQTFRGKKITEFYSYNSGCSFYGKLNSKWLVFAYTNDNGVLLTSHCSGNIDFDPEIDETKYPNLNLKLSKRLSTKLNVLEFLQKKDISTLDEYGLWIGKNRATSIESWEGFVEAETFAVYEQTLNSDLEVIKVKPIKEFKNRKLSRRILKGMKTQTYVYRRDCTKDINDIGKIIVVLYYYPNEGENKSFISSSDL